VHVRDLGGQVLERAVTDDGDRADDLVRAPRQARDELARLGGVGGLAEDVAVERDDRVGAQDEGRRSDGGAVRRRPGDRERLAARVLLGRRDGIAVLLLLDARDDDLERDTDLRENRPPLRRSTRED
jgi:hypothetical protein